MKQIALIFALLSGMAVAQPGPADLIANIPGRTTVSLDGTGTRLSIPMKPDCGQSFMKTRKRKTGAIWLSTTSTQPGR